MVIQMTDDINIFMGIDVSKDSLDIYLKNKHYKIKNENRSISNFIKLEILKPAIKIKLCALESTGGYEKLAIKLLHKAQINVHRAHPNRVYSFAKTVNHFAKTDKLDSILLAKYAKFISSEATEELVISDINDELKNLEAIEFDLEMNIQANKNRLHHLDKKAASYIKKHISFMEKQLVQIRSEIDNKIDNNPDLHHKRDILTSYNGIGKKTASVLLIALPELGLINNKKIASLVGLAPKTTESGKKVNKAHISGGRFYVRKALYMSALVAARYNDKIKAFYDKLIAKGKAPKVALVAVMRKIIICLNSMIKHNAFFS